jgi:hypothetical protein
LYNTKKPEKYGKNFKLRKENYEK